MLFITLYFIVIISQKNFFLIVNNMKVIYFSSGWFVRNDCSKINFETYNKILYLIFYLPEQ